MFVNIKLGLADIWKHKLTFILSVFFLFLLHLVLFLTVYNIYVEKMHQQLNQSNTRKFNVVFTDYDLTYKKDYADELATIYQKNAVSTRMSQSLSSRYNRLVYLVFGDGSLLHPQINSSDDIAVFAYETDTLSQVEVFGENYQAIQLSCDESCDMSSDAVFILFQNEALVTTIDDLAKSNSSNFYELVSNTEINPADTDKIEQFKNFITNKLKNVSLKNEGYEPYDSSIEFIDHYYIPLVMILLITAVLSFILIYQGILENMKRELTMHILHGALLKDVLVRFFIFYGLIIIGSLGLFYFQLNMNYLPEEVALVLTSYLVVLTILMTLYIVYSLKKTNLFENLRGDIV